MPIYCVRCRGVAAKAGSAHSDDGRGQDTPTTAPDAHSPRNFDWPLALNNTEGHTMTSHYTTHCLCGWSNTTVSTICALNQPGRQPVEGVWQRSKVILGRVHPPPIGHTLHTGCFFDVGNYWILVASILPPPDHILPANVYMYGFLGSHPLPLDTLQMTMPLGCAPSTGVPWSIPNPSTAKLCSDSVSPNASANTKQVTLYALTDVLYHSFFFLSGIFYHSLSHHPLLCCPWSTTLLVPLTLANLLCFLLWLVWL